MSSKMTQILPRTASGGLDREKFGEEPWMVLITISCFFYFYFNFMLTRGTTYRIAKRLPLGMLMGNPSSNSNRG
jgi:hypothetical protein